MQRELIKITGKRSVLDPRTKLALLVAVAVVVLGAAGDSRMFPFVIILSVLPLAFLFGAAKRKAAVIGGLLMALGYWIQYEVLTEISGAASYILLLLAGVITRLIPGILMGAYVLSSTTVSEFMAAFSRIHVPDTLTIPLSVVFRFFPTIMEEFSSINTAMRMREIRLGGRQVTKAVEYRLIPMMTCTVKIGEELSASALTRGLGGPKKRTNICDIGFRAGDYIIFAFLLVMVAYGVAVRLEVLG